MNLSPREYREAIHVVESAILSTDLALYFRKKDHFRKLVDAEADWSEPDNREMLRWASDVTNLHHCPIISYKAVKG